MGRNVYYLNGDGEEQKLSAVTKVERQGEFTEVEFTPALSRTSKTTMIRTENIIRYDEN